MFSRDRMTNVRAQVVAESAMAVIDRLQTMRYKSPEVQVLAVSVVFLELLRKHKIHAQSALETVENIVNKASEYTPELRAVRMYVEREMS